MMDNDDTRKLQTPSLLFLNKNNYTTMAEKRFRIEFKEVNYGFVDVWAESEDEAREKAECYEGNLETTKSYLDLGNVSEVYDPEGNDDVEN